MVVYRSSRDEKPTRSRSRSRSRSQSVVKRGRGRSGRGSLGETSVPSRDRYTSDMYYLGGLAKAVGMTIPNLGRKYWKFRKTYPEATLKTIALHIFGDTYDVATLGVKLGWYAAANVKNTVKNTPNAIVSSSKRARSSLRRLRDNSLDRVKGSLNRVGSSFNRVGSSLKHWWQAEPQRSRSRSRSRNRKLKFDGN